MKRLDQWSLKFQRLNLPTANFRQSGYPFATKFYNKKVVRNKKNRGAATKLTVIKSKSIWTEASSSS